jgi:hypothetical protein
MSGITILPHLLQAVTEYATLSMLRRSSSVTALSKSSMRIRNSTIEDMVHTPFSIRTRYLFRDWPPLSQVNHARIRTLRLMQRCVCEAPHTTTC